MKTTGQGFQHGTSRYHRLFHVLLLLVILAVRPAAAGTGEETQPPASGIAVVSIIYSGQSTLQKEIALELLRRLTTETVLFQKPFQIRLLQVDNAEPPAENTRHDTALAVVIGSSNVTYARQYFTGTPFLFLVTDPSKLRATDLGNEDSILYMTQPLCRQIRFIHLLNPRWKHFSYLTSRTDYPDTGSMQACAEKNAMQAYRQYNTDPEHLSGDLKTALYHSDLLLALPDKNIYNRKTVKNILLTSYRLRKPVIAFSANFVNAGALAAIHSSTDQISIAAAGIVAAKLSGDRQTARINYPDGFEISINRQVFRALALDLPDIESITRRLTGNTPAATEGTAGDTK